MEPKQAKNKVANKDADARGHMLLQVLQGLDLGGSRGEAAEGRAWTRPTATTAWKRQHSIAAKSRATIRHPLRLNNACARRNTAFFYK